jgi:hypothetical protein
MMGNPAIVNGYIGLHFNGTNVHEDAFIEEHRQIIAKFPFDDKYPFANIFWIDSPAKYFYPVIGFTGSFKDIHLDWEEWLWKFSQLLTLMEANDARVQLDSLWGYFAYRLRPKGWDAPWNSPENKHHPGYEYPRFYMGKEWGIVEAPAWDFSFRPDLAGTCEGPKWDKFVQRWVPPTTSKEESQANS